MKPKMEKPLQQRVTRGKFKNIDMRVAKIVSAPLAEGTDNPCRFFTLDAGHLGNFESVGQYALIPEEELVGRNVIILANLAPLQIGPYESQVLVLGVPHPDTPEDQDQALPLYVDSRAVCGDKIF